jgi:hypothetical protein
MPLDAITPAMQIDPIVAAKLRRTVFQAVQRTDRPD